MGGSIPLHQVRRNRFLQFTNVLKDSAPDGLIGDFRAEALHQVQPGTRCRREVQVDALVGLQPGPHIRVLVRRVVVHDHFQAQVPGCLTFELLEEAQELIVAMTLYALTD